MREYISVFVLTILLLLSGVPGGVSKGAYGQEKTGKICSCFGVDSQDVALTSGTAAKVRSPGKWQDSRAARIRSVSDRGATLVFVRIVDGLKSTCVISLYPFYKLLCSYLC